MITSTERPIAESQVTQTGALSLQVCVDERTSDEDAVSFANSANLCGTQNGWFIRKAGDKHLCGSPERQPCASREGCVHIMLDC